MKSQTLKENEPIKDIKATYHWVIPTFPNMEPRISEEEIVQMKIFTDGELDKVSELIVEPINDYIVDYTKYSADTLKTRDLYFKNYSFVITYLLVKRWVHFRHMHSYVDTIAGVKK